MNKIFGTTFLLLAFASLLEPQTKHQALVWQPAVYRGLTVGKSTVAEVKRVLGKPYWVGREEQTGTPMSVYLVTDPFPASLEVFMSGGKLDLLRLNPKEPLTRRDAIRLFGSDFRVTRYSFTNCLPTSEEQMYEDPDGETEQIEYRQRGIALNVHEGQIDVILYVSSPFGPTKSPCVQAKGKVK